MDHKNKGLNGNQLKLIAVVCMLTDHIAYRLINGNLLLRYPAGSELYRNWQLVSMVMRTVGRIAFPIFVLLLTEGFIYTRSRKAYALRLAGLALVSEIPFNYITAGSFRNPGYQSTILTLFIGFLALWCMDALGPRMKEGMQLPMICGVTLLASLLALVLCTDYDYSGVILIVLCYWLRYQPERRALFGFFWITYHSEKWYYAFGYLAAFYLIYHYSGEKGKGPGKYAFYIFYPLHLAVLYALNLLI